MIGSVKWFDSNKIMSFKATDKKLLKEYNEIWERFRSITNTEFDSEPVYGDNEKYIKTRIKLCGDKTNTNFQKYQKKSIIQMFFIDNVGFCY